MSEQSKRDAIVEILDNRFSLQDLRVLCFDLGIDYDSLNGPSLPVKSRALVEYAEQRQQLEDIVSYLPIFRPDIDLSEYGLATELAGPPIGTPAIAFSNRTHELDQLTNPFGPTYVLIDAPAGYGKSSLLQELKNRYDALGWACANVDFRQEPLDRSRLLVVNALGKCIEGYHCPETGSVRDDKLEQAHIDRFVQALHGVRRGCILFFDSVEQLQDEDMREWLLDKLVLYAFQELEKLGFMREGRKFRVIFAGRYVAHLWSELAEGRLILSVKSLTPFDLDALRDTVRQVAKGVGVSLQEQDVHSTSEHLMRLSGGHPKCMADILSDLASYGFVGLGSYFDLDGQESIYGDIVQPTIEDVKRGIPRNLRSAFECLSVLRRFRPDTILHLVAQGELEPSSATGTNEEFAWSLFQEIMATHLIQWNEGFYCDGIIRRLLSIEMCRQARDRYVSLCENAMQLYQTWLDDPQESGYLLAIEITYQQVQHYAATQAGEPEQVLEGVCRTFDHYLDQSSTPFERRQRLMNLKNALDRDWEWRFTINGVLGSGTDTLISRQLGLDAPLGMGGSLCR